MYEIVREILTKPLPLQIPLLEKLLGVLGIPNKYNLGYQGRECREEVDTLHPDRWVHRLNKTTYTGQLTRKG